jgi:uncharacterized protein YbjT (DUF2867 family)
VKVIIFGATGMVGQGVLLECLRDPGVEPVLVIVRRPTGRTHAKLTELVHGDFADFSAVESQLAGYDACFFCLGVTSAGMSEADYTRVTVDYTLAAARPLARLNPNMTFVFVSGAGTDSSGTSRTMWARVKGRAENEVFALPFRRAYAFRPAFIQPLDGITSRTTLYRVFYKLLAPVVPLLRRIAPKYVTTTAEVGRAMLRVAREGWGKKVLENADIVAAGRAG